MLMEFHETVIYVKLIGSNRPGTVPNLLTLSHVRLHQLFVQDADSYQNLVIF